MQMEGICRRATRWVRHQPSPDSNKAFSSTVSSATSALAWELYCAEFPAHEFCRTLISTNTDRYRRRRQPFLPPVKAQKNPIEARIRSQGRRGRLPTLASGLHDEV